MRWNTIRTRTFRNTGRRANVHGHRRHGRIERHANADKRSRRHSGRARRDDHGGGGAGEREARPGVDDRRAHGDGDGHAHRHGHGGDRCADLGRQGRLEQDVELLVREPLRVRVQLDLGEDNRRECFT